MQNHFPFTDAENTATITCYHVMHNNAPILHISHDADDGMWQFLCGRSHGTDDAMVVGLGDIYHHDASIGELADLPLGFVAERKRIDKKWKIKKQK